MQPLKQEQAVIDTALDLVRSLPADSNHTVAAAAMDSSGRIHTGVNVQHFTGGPCAELVVLAVAAAAGAGPLVTMAAAGDGGRALLAPCGRCRQVLTDLHPDLLVAVPGECSPTSEFGKITKSTPDGSLDHPFSPVSLVLGAEATFVARTRDTYDHRFRLQLAAAQAAGPNDVQNLFAGHDSWTVS